MKRARALTAVLLGIGALLLPTMAPAQNLEAGKSPGQLFTNTCTACHRSPRGLLRTVPPGSLPGFLREHYTTSRDMAQQLAGFLISNGATDTRGRPQEARQQPPGMEPPRQPRPGEPEQQQQRPRQAEPEQQVRPQRPIEQEQARPPEPPQTAQSAAEAARLARRERRAKREAERAARSAAVPNASESLRKDQNRRSRITPARIEAATARGKDALPLGSVVPSPPPVEAATPETAAPAAEPVKPAAAVTSSDPPMRSDPVPQVTPAPPVRAEAPRDVTEPVSGSDDAPSGSTAPAEPLAPAPPASSGPPPAPPISN